MSIETPNQITESALPDAPLTGASDHPYDQDKQAYSNPGDAQEAAHSESTGGDQPVAQSQGETVTYDDSPLADSGPTFSSWFKPGEEVAPSLHPDLETPAAQAGVSDQDTEEHAGALEQLRHFIHPGAAD